MDGVLAATLPDLLDSAVRYWPQYEAVCSTSSEERWTYAELDARSRKAATWLSEHDVQVGDRILVLSSNRMELVALVFAATRLGAAFVLIDPRTKQFHLRHILLDAAPRVVLTDQSSLVELREASPTPVHTLDSLWSHHGRPSVGPVESDGDRTACLIYTSGSTAMPKAVVESHAQMIFATAAIATRLQYRPGDRILCCLPLSFDYGLYQVFLAALSGATLVLGTESDAGPSLIRVLHEEQISVFPVVPILAANLVRLAERRPTTLPRLRLITNTGAALTESTITSLRQRFPGLAVILMFGLTECKRVSILDPNGDLKRPGSVGRPLPGTECRIVDEEGAAVPAGEVGELVVQGPHVMSGYWRAPELTARRFRTDSNGQRVLFTGDYCRLDDDGFLYFIGRRDDIYKQRGARVSALEVEAAAADTRLVREAAVLVPDGDRGAHLVVVGDVHPETVMAALSKRLPAFKLPSGCTVLVHLPRTTNGKVDKRALRILVDRALPAT